MNKTNSTLAWIANSKLERKRETLNKEASKHIVHRMVKCWSLAWHLPQRGSWRKAKEILVPKTNVLTQHTWGYRLLTTQCWSKDSHSQLRDTGAPSIINEQPQLQVLLWSLKPEIVIVVALDHHWGCAWYGWWPQSGTQFSYSMPRHLGNAVLRCHPYVFQMYNASSATP